ncbi:MAG: HAMP domain-containing histidine kinase [Vicinamibacteria bacterium]|nr:HAMP domain-containing histidine kinase [Vicinamibacteria bacterium]
MNSITQRMTRATVTVAVIAALFLASASALSSRFVFEAQEQRILRNSALALAEAVRREVVDERLPLGESARDSIFESGLADDAIEVWKGGERVATSQPGVAIGLSSPGVITWTPSWLAITVDIVDDVKLVVASPRDRGERAWRIFGWSLLLATPLAILIAVFIGRRTAATVAGPLLSFRDRIVATTPLDSPPLGRTDDPLEVRELDLAFRAQWQRVRDSFDRERDFAANAAHELRTPLTRLLLLAERAREGGVEGQAALRHQIDEIARMSRLVDALLVLARSGESLALGTETVNLADLLREAAGAVSNEPSLRPHVVAPDEALVRGDEDLLRIAVINLLENAVKFGRPGTPPRAALEMSDGRLALRVTTPGSRIGHDEGARLFERFYRGPEARAEQPGHGLGLSLARHVARLHGGDVVLSSTETEDACFVLDLPAWRSA